MPERPPTTLLADALDIPIWLERDADQSLRERKRRDREIAGRLDVTDPAARVRGWWRLVRDDHDTLPGGDSRRGALPRGAVPGAASPGNALPGHSIAHGRAWVSLALVIVGAIGGAGLAIAAFAYDGSYPVNVVRLLAMLVVPQLLLLVLNLLLIPGRLPGLGFVQDALAAINPGALAAAVFRQLERRSEAGVFGWAAARTSAARRFGKWQMLHWSQTAAVALNLGVIATAAILIAFTDLAFGWSTTVNVDGQTAARIFGAIAAPWAGIFPEAVPDPALVERSQYFRLDPPASLPDSRVLTQWWSFTVLAVVVYGLLPRIAFLCVTGWRLRAATRAMLLDDPGVTALLDRMSAPEIETRGEAHAVAPVTAQPVGVETPVAALQGSAAVVVWSHALDPDNAADFLRSRLGLAATDRIAAGTESLDTDRQAIGRLTGGLGSVVVLTPAWEPPLLEFVDFLASLRAAIGPSRSILVVPVGESLQQAEAADLENWRAAVQASGDSRTYVEAGNR